jgi:hypothetical protein
MIARIWRGVVQLESGRPSSQCAPVGPRSAWWNDSPVLSVHAALVGGADQLDVVGHHLLPDVGGG